MRSESTSLTLPYEVKFQACAMRMCATGSAASAWSSTFSSVSSSYCSPFEEASVVASPPFRTIALTSCFSLVCSHHEDPPILANLYCIQLASKHLKQDHRDRVFSLSSRVMLARRRVIPWGLLS
eukprot:Blabericola_migrator_1__3615@NODE_2079_length_3309_cov_28_991055_g1317_i0_p2_GENE_NODE_2079_length_3309_cov_28_991055_g1317_i0NODE_2079_length_3309_cov_28_991055_g1317_i0_p2_ORF_typecomplete_len124_score7_15DUF4472/PF14739_6/0_22_NODE_2079_length_3309_cov_28_991055_g1317_i027413112